VRHVALLLLAALTALGCRPHLKRPPGDEAPYPALDTGALDRSTSPCQDFYQFACGGWVAGTALPPDRGQLTLGEGELEERNARLLRKLLEDAGAGRVDPKDRFGRKAGDYYAACMDEPDVEARGLAELQAEWARIDAVEDRGELLDELGRLEAMGLEVPLRLRAEPDAQAPAAALLVLAPGDAVLPAAQLREAEGARGSGQRARLEEMLRTMLLHAGRPAAEAGPDAEAALALELALAEGRLGPAEGAAAARLHPRTDQAALERLAPGLDWDRLLRAAGAGGLEAVGVADPAFLARLAQLVAEAPLPAWKAYLRWRLLEATARERALPSALVLDRFLLARELPGAPAAQRPRWKHCVDATVRAFELGVGEAFGRKHLGRGGRERAGALLAATRRALSQRIGAVAWMDPPTRVRAAAKLERLAVLVGYGEAAPDYGALRTLRGSWFRDLLSAGRFAVAQELARAARPVERDGWWAGPARAEPLYSAAQNALILPAGLLQPPIDNPQAPPAVVLGALGARIGRGLVEVLQGEGRLHDAAGRAGDWWTPAAAAGWEARAACLARQVGAEAAPGCLADQGGLRLAWEALRAEQAAQPGAARKLRGFTPEQQLFLGWAQTLCTVPADGATAAGEPPTRLRVNGAVSSLAEFAQAFRCEPSSPMALPDGERCDAW
jgi:putative endopeptidase